MCIQELLLIFWLICGSSFSCNPTQFNFSSSHSLPATESTHSFCVGYCQPRGVTSQYRRAQGQVIIIAQTMYTGYYYYTLLLYRRYVGVCAIFFLRRALCGLHSTKFMHTLNSVDKREKRLQRRRERERSRRERSRRASETAEEREETKSTVRARRKR